MVSPDLPDPPRDPLLFQTWLLLQEIRKSYAEAQALIHWIRTTRNQPPWQWIIIKSGQGVKDT